MKQLIALAPAFSTHPGFPLRTPAMAVIYSVITIVLLTGCMSAGYTRTEPNGEKITFSTSSLWTKKTIKDVQYSVGTNGSRAFRLQGLSEDQTQVAMQALLAALQAYSNQPKPAPPANP